MYLVMYSTKIQMKYISHDSRGSNENPSVQELFQNTATVIQQKMCVHGLEKYECHTNRKHNGDMNFDLLLPKRKKKANTVHPGM